MLFFMSNQGFSNFKVIPNWILRVHYLVNTVAADAPAP